jgi:hypothetical protein
MKIVEAEILLNGGRVLVTFDDDIQRYFSADQLAAVKQTTEEKDLLRQFKQETE